MSSPSSTAGMSIPPIAQTLPFPVLVNIFEFCLVIDGFSDEEDVPPPEAEHGGLHVRWDSNQDLAPFAIVCSHWKDAANHVLYKSISITGKFQAQSYLRTVRAKPQYANLCRALVLGHERGENGEDATRDQGHAQVAELLLKVTQSCVRIQTLQIRPMHHSIGRRLYRLLANRPLKTLVVGPRLSSANERWTEPLFDTSTLPIALPSVVSLEINTWVKEVRLQYPLPPFPQLALRHLSLLHVAIPDELFSSVLESSPALEFLEVESDHIFRVETLIRGFNACVGSLKWIKFVCNPSEDGLRLFTASGVQPVFDRLLPHFRQLETLACSATEVSFNVFSLVPPSLRQVKVQALNHLSCFYYTAKMIEHLEDLTMPLGLKSFEVHDAADAWEQVQIDTLAHACRNRGVDFRFFPDEAEWDDI